MHPITFTVPGNPVPQPRPQFTVKYGIPRAFVKKRHRVHAYRAAIASKAAAAGLTQSIGPVEVIVDAVFRRPKSHMTKAGVKPTAPQLPLPDVDNIAKAVLDGLQCVIGDDKKVRRLVIEKSYGTEARTTVRIQ